MRLFDELSECLNYKSSLKISTNNYNSKKKKLKLNVHYRLCFLVFPHLNFA